MESSESDETVLQAVEESSLTRGGVGSDGSGVAVTDGVGSGGGS